jgi:uncharacterized damage-inducible protein DinB
MDVAALLRETFDRIPPLVRSAVEDLSADKLATPPADGANTIAWLVWHLTRVEDDHLAGVMGGPQVWEEDAWAERFGLAPGTTDTGYGHAPEDVLAIRARAADLVAYHEEVAGRTVAFLDGLGPEDLDRVVDEDWDPPVTLGVRLVSVADDALQHAGQAAYVRGLLSSD